MFDRNALANFFLPRRHGGTEGGLFVFALTVFVCLAFSACGGSGAPIDAGTRQRIDSTSNAQIRLAREELDSICILQRTTVLPQLVDSIKQKRLSEIREQMKTVPK